MTSLADIRRRDFAGPGVMACATQAVASDGIRSAMIFEPVTGDAVLPA